MPSDLLHWPDDVLRRATWTNSPASGQRTFGRLLATMAACGLLYGAAMGSFGAVAGGSNWPLQMLYSALKVPLLLSVTFVISVPSFYVMNALFGLGGDFAVALRNLLATQAGFTVLLAAFAPLTLFWYATDGDYSRALVANGVMFAAASLASQRLLRGYYRPLVAGNARHRKMMWLWTGLYALVAIQMAWLLRPFIGSPDKQVTFFRPEAWDNAYLKVWELVVRVFS
ncbi:hypothetical protein NG895_01045 [Aeoliella sp. ICT_H6.2]|uniref:Uncharacterized protein n=1 Tax=Aeoliella straminimaris TaxID=2954799 RepID=A0A9X2F579_9BACT|nr:hypothetical protein [Aeoliella straminimaris]MCO6042482.1 hypothetical protein [Aeoliella straminimaris]